MADMNDNHRNQELPNTGLPGYTILRISSFALAYFFVHLISFLFPDTQKVLVGIWPAGGIGLAAMLLNPRRLWPGISAGIFIAGNMANLLSGRPLATSLGFMTANVAESLLCAWFITSLCGEEVRFNRVREVMALVGASTLINASTALIGSGTASLATGASFWDFLITWWIADALGILIVAPLIVSWAGFRVTYPEVRWAKRIEFAVFMAIWCAVSMVSFQPVDLMTMDISRILAPRPYVLIVLLAWPALRFGLRGVTFALIVLAVLAVMNPAVIDGPLLWGGNTLTERLLHVQIFLGITSVTGFLLSSTYGESRLAEKASREGEERLKALGDNIPNGMVYQILREPDGALRFLYVSAGVERINGVSAEEVLRDSSVLFNLLMEEDRPLMAAAQEAALRDMTIINRTLRFRRPDGRVRWMQISATPRSLDDGGIMWDGIELDITERIEAEEAQRRSEEHAGTILREMNDGFWIVDLAGRIIDVNDSMCRMLGYPKEELMSLNVADVEAIDSPDAIAQRIRKISEQGGDRFESQHKRRDGRIIDVEESITYNRARNLIYSFHRDITERKKAEEELRKALADRETLLRELNHRTKNNMQVISSLLDLQGDYSGDERMKEAFRDTQNRISSMALVHQKLYQAKDLSHVNLKDYISDLISLLMTSYHISTGRISVDAVMEDVFVLIDSAIPCGLILNELISNTLKYAFPDGREGTITVRLVRNSDGGIDLLVADDGIGVPAGFDFRKNRRLGLQNIFALGENQLKGKVNFEEKNGVTCRLVFRDNLYSPRV